MQRFIGFRVHNQDADLLKQKAETAGVPRLAYARYVFTCGLRVLQVLQHLREADALRAALDLPAPPAPRKAA